jgi:RHS repeat-associated protein
MYFFRIAMRSTVSWLRRALNSDPLRHVRRSHGQVTSVRGHIFIYGPAGLLIEQINNSTGTVTYLHHDQAGSTRLLTGSTGTVTGKCSYAAYGTPTCEGTATTPLGFDGQYTSSDTGLIYLRHRVYDPATAQFLTADPLEMYTREPYGYAGDNPLNYGDPSGLAGESIGEAPSCPPGICFPFPNTKETERAIEAAKELGHEIGYGIESVWNEVTGEGESNKEGTQTQSSSECGEAYTGNQDALIKIANEAKRNGLSPEDAEVLREWAEEYDVPFRRDEGHPNRPLWEEPHYKIGSQNHIPER